MNDYINDVDLKGFITSTIDFTFQYEDENFFKFILSVARPYGIVDNIPVVISESVFKQMKPEKGSYYSVWGQLRNYDNYALEKRKFEIYVFANDIIGCMPLSYNKINLKGMVVQNFGLSQTPFGRLKCEVVVAVNRANVRDYIPVVAWQRNASELSEIKCGQMIELNGSLQNRIIKTTGANDENVSFEQNILEVCISESNFNL